MVHGQLMTQTLMEFLSRHFLAAFMTLVVATTGYLGVISQDATSTLLGTIAGYVLKNGSNHLRETTKLPGNV